MADGHEPGGAVDRRAEVVGAAPLGVARVERHPDVERAGLAPVGGGQGALGGEAGRDALVGRGEDRHHPVAGRLDHDAVGRFDRLAEDHVMTRQGVGHRGGLVLPEPGAPCDVGEQEGQRAGPDDGGGGFAGVGSVHGSTIRGSDVKGGAGLLRLRLWAWDRGRGRRPSQACVVAKSGAGSPPTPPSVPGTECGRTPDRRLMWCVPIVRCRTHADHDAIGQSGERLVAAMQQWKPEGPLARGLDSSRGVGPTAQHPQRRPARHPGRRGGTASRPGG